MEAAYMRDRRNAFIREQKVPSASMLSIKFEMMTSFEMEKFSNFTVIKTSDLMKSNLGLPNQAQECATCGGTHMGQCDGHAGIIKLPTTIFHPFFLKEIVQILNDICPGCKLLRQNTKSENTTASNWALLGVESDCKYCSGCSHEWYPIMKFRIMKDKLNSGSILVEVNEKAPRFNDKNLNTALPEDYWNFIANDGQVKEFPGLKVLLSPLQVFHLLKKLDVESFERYMLKRELLFLSSIPIAPHCSRITEINIGSGSPKVIFDDRTRAYKKLIESRRKVDHEIQQDHHSFGVVMTGVLECLSFSKLHPRSSPCGDSASVSGLKWVKDVVLCKRSDFACRMTVIGDSHIKLCEIGIPVELSSKLFVPDYITVHNQNLWNTVCSKLLKDKDIFVNRRGMKIIPCYPTELQIGDDLCIQQEGGDPISVRITSHNQRMCNSICSVQKRFHEVYVRRKNKPLHLPVELDIGDVLYRPLQDGDLLLINRPPSVHQHSLIALSTRILPTKSVFSINPLCCAPFSGDFDGDCLHGYVPQSIHSKVELTELVHLDKQLLNGQDGRSLISLSQDSLTAAHLLTANIVFLRKHEMQQLHVSPSCLLKHPAIIKAPSLMAPLWTGQQLFSSFLPEIIDFSVTSQMIHISKGEVLVSPIKSSWLQNSVDGLFSRITKCCGGKALDYFFLAQEVLSEWISMRGFSVSLEDIHLSSNAYDRAKLIQEVKCGILEAEHATNVINQLMNPEVVHLLSNYNGGNDTSCITDDEIGRILYCKGRILGEQSFEAFKEIFNELQYVVPEYARKDNSMLSMIYAGSKGSLMKLVHQSVCLGLQHSKSFLSYRMPPMLSCAFGNQYKVSSLCPMDQDTADYIEKCSSYAVIKSSFLDGLNPFECFLHSLSGRMNLFSENAEFPGTLTRKLMFYMRDLFCAYDGSVRNSYGEQVVQFNYNVSERMSTENLHCEKEMQAGQPIGALAACAVSEAAYSALELPTTSAETSPLLKLKNLFDLSYKSMVFKWAITLALSKKLRKWDYGSEYAALEVKKHLERVFFSDIVSTVLIFYAGQDLKIGFSPWVVHFHLRKESLHKNKLTLNSIVDILKKEYNLTADKLTTTIPKLQISSRLCSLDGMHEKEHMENCIIVTAEDFESAMELDYVQETIIPILLHTIVKGSMDVQRVDILWSDHSAELSLKIFLSESCEREKCWNNIQNACLPVMDLIDWDSSHPENVYDISVTYGIDAAWKYFEGNLKATTATIGRQIYAEHLHLVADCLSISGEFHPLTAKGIKHQKEQLSITTPFVQGFFSAPEKNFIGAAKQESVDPLLGTVDAMAWGKEAPLGTGGPFKLLYSSKHFSEIGNIYGCLKDQHAHQQQNEENVELPIHHLSKEKFKLAFAHGSWRSQESNNQLEVNEHIGDKSIPSLANLVTSLRNILHQYPLDAYLKEEDKALVVMALTFHPKRDAKIGIGIKDIKIGRNPRFPESRCYIVERIDGTSDDFSYRKCVKGAFDNFSPASLKSICKRI